MSSKILPSTAMRMRAWPAWVSTALAWAALGLAGCSGHEGRVRDALDALDRGAPQEAIGHLDEEMEVASSTELPKNLEGDNALLLLDRASIQTWIGRYDASTTDFGAADKVIEMLDMRHGAADELGKYLFSDSVGRYKAPAYEKIMINTMNIASYLAQGKLSDAKVEGRRLAVLQKFLEDQKEETTLLGLGSYLSGFAFEKAGDRDEALVFYEEALKYKPYASLVTPLASLTGGTSSSKRISDLIAGQKALAPVASTGECDLVVVVNIGRVPPKEPVRLPIGLALTIVAGSLSPGDTARANELAAKGLVTWINFPRLGKSRGVYSDPSVSLDGAAPRSRRSGRRRSGSAGGLRGGRAHDHSQRNHASSRARGGRRADPARGWRRASRWRRRCGRSPGRPGCDDHARCARHPRHAFVDDAPLARGHRSLPRESGRAHDPRLGARHRSRHPPRRQARRLGPGHDERSSLTTTGRRAMARVTRELGR